MPRKRRDPAFKAKVAMKALKGIKTLSELAAEYDVHPVRKYVNGHVIFSRQTRECAHRRLLCPTDFYSRQHPHKLLIFLGL